MRLRIGKLGSLAGVNPPGLGVRPPGGPCAARRTAGIPAGAKTALGSPDWASRELAGADPARPLTATGCLHPSSRTKPDRDSQAGRPIPTLAEFAPGTPLARKL